MRIVGTNLPEDAWFNPVAVATTGASILLSGQQTIDGVTVGAFAAGDPRNLRILVKDQANAIQNGIYDTNTGTWTRALDANDKTQWAQGVQVLVTGGTQNGFTIWQCTTTPVSGQIIPGTHQLMFGASKLNILAGTGIANQILLSQAAAAPQWSTATFPADVSDAGQILNSTAAHTWSATASPTIATSVTVPAIYGGTAVGATLNILGTSNGAPNNDTINLSATAVNFLIDKVAGTGIFLQNSAEISSGTGPNGEGISWSSYYRNKDGTAPIQGRELAFWQVWAWDGIQLSPQPAPIAMVAGASENWTTTSHGAVLFFQTVPNGQNNSSNEFAIGNGITSLPPSSAGEVQGNGVGTITAGSSAGYYIGVSTGSPHQVLGISNTHYTKVFGPSASPGTIQVGDSTDPTITIAPKAVVNGNATTLGTGNAFSIVPTLQITPPAGSFGSCVLDTIGNVASYHILRNTGGTIGSPSATVAAQLGGFLAAAYDGSAYHQCANFLFQTLQTVSGTQFGTRIDFSTTPLNTTALANCVTIHGSGGLMVGANAAATDPGAYSIRSAGAILSQAASGGIGYVTGAGGAVTQTTSRTTGVTLNTVAGAITLVSAAGSASFQSFTVTNSSVAATDVISVNQKSGTDKYQIFVTNVGAGSFQITFATTGGTTTEQPVFQFAVIKGANS